jgi:hypothetical protein
MKVTGVPSTQQALPRPGRSLRSIIEGRRAAFWFFTVALIVIFILYIWNFHGRWFIADEWDFLAGRTAGNLRSLFRPHNEHWSTLPILYFRLLWHFVGIRSYMPYLVSVLACHFFIACLLRFLMIRANVTPWIATIVSLIFALFGAGYSDIDYAFNIGFDGSLIFGLTFLLLVDHSGALDRRDAFGIVAGLAGLMCSAIGVTMVIVVGIAVLLRHGIRRALLMVVPLGAVYLAWYAAIGHTYQGQFSDFDEIVRFAALGIGSTFSSIGHSAVVGSVLAALVIVGIVILVRTNGISEIRTGYAAPFALLAGCIVFMLITGLGRATGGSLPSTDTYAASRYLYVAAALLMPAIGIAASVLISRWPILSPIILAVLIVGIPGNIMVLHQNDYLHTLDGYRTFFLSIPRLPIANRLPRSMHPDPLFDSIVTVGWLEEGVKSGRIPAPSPPPTAAQQAGWTLTLAWHRVPTMEEDGCHAIQLPAIIGIDSNTRVTIDSPVYVAYLYRSGSRTPPLKLGTFTGSATFASYWPMTARFSGTRPSQSMTVCTGADPEPGR